MRYLLLVMMVLGLAGCQDASDVGAPRLAAVVLFSENPEQTVAFYRHLGVGLKTFQMDGIEYWAGRLGDLELVIDPAEPGQASERFTNGATELSIAVGRLDRVLDHLEKVGVKPEQGPEKKPWGMRVLVRDPDGRTVELVEKGV